MSKLPVESFRNFIIPLIRVSTYISFDAMLYCRETDEVKQKIESGHYRAVEIHLEEFK